MSDTEKPDEVDYDVQALRLAAALVDAAAKGARRMLDTGAKVPAAEDALAAARALRELKLHVRSPEKSPE